MNLKKIYRDLGYSIRKVNEDEIEIKNSTWDGYIRGFFRTMIIASLLVISFLDYRYGQTPLLGIYQSIEKDFIWAFNPDQIIKPLYNEYVTFETNPEMIKKYNITEKIMSYEEYRKPYIENHFWRTHVFYFELIPISLLFILFFYPRHRSIRLNRKERVIYMQAFHMVFVVPVPKKGDPLMGMKYNRFSFYMFGSRKQFALLMTALVVEGKYTEAELLGCYPLPNHQHNMHLIKAMREFFTHENPEFLKYIGRFYRTPWFRPAIAFCNSFCFLRFPFSSKKKIKQAIAEQKAFWNSLSYKQQMQRYAVAVKEQQELNELLASEGLINEVNNDWQEEEPSPALQNL